MRETKTTAGRWQTCAELSRAGGVIENKLKGVVKSKALTEPFCSGQLDGRALLQAKTYRPLSHIILNSRYIILITFDFELFFGFN
jgi:hypothetical protein